MYNPSFSLADIVSIGRLKQGFLATDLADFSAFDPSFSATYLSDFLAAIEMVEAFPDDETVTDILTGFTIARDEKWAECRKYYQKMKFFIEKAFPTSLPIQNEFGFNEYGECTKSVEKMIRFMYKLYQTAGKYSSELTQANVTAADIALIKSLHDELSDLDYKQEAYKSERQKHTEKRSELMEALYKNYIGYVCKAGKLIYVDSPALYARYLLPSRHTSNSPRTQTLGAQERTLVNAETKVDDFYSLQITGSGSLLFYIAPNGSTAVPTTAINVTANTQGITYSAQDLGFDSNLSVKQALFAYNPNNEEVVYSAALLE